MILADTSIWIDHLRGARNGLNELLTGGEVLVHPLVIGELACASLKDRALILSSLEELPAARLALHHEVIALIDQRKLWGRGLGLVDINLLASALLTECRLWTRDQRLATAAKSLGVG